MAKNCCIDSLAAVILTEADIPGAKLTKEPKECLVKELERWLECHGLKKSGKKDELVTRVQNSLCLGLPVDPKVDGGKWYNIKATSATNNDLQHSTEQALPSSGWKSFPSRNLPENFNYGHVYHYLVESVDDLYVTYGSASDEEDTVESSGDTITARPLRKGRSLLQSGFIEDIQDNFIDNLNEYIVRAHVQHSMKSFLPLNVTVTVSNISGYVKTASCDCIASSLGRCAHIAAVLLKLSDTENIIEPSTSKPCTWNKGKKRVKNPTQANENHHQCCMLGILDQRNVEV